MRSCCLVVPKLSLPQVGQAQLPQPLFMSHVLELLVVPSWPKQNLSTPFFHWWALKLHLRCTLTCDI